MTPSLRLNMSPYLELLRAMLKKLLQVTYFPSNPASCILLLPPLHVYMHTLLYRHTLLNIVHQLSNGIFCDDENILYLYDTVATSHLH